MAHGSGMGKIYTLQEPGAEAPDIVAELFKQNHKNLAQAGVTVAVIMVESDADEEGEDTSVLKVGGYPALATVKITSLKDRSLDMADAQIEVDAKAWDEMSDRRKRAIIDHELSHLGVVRDKNATLLRDNHGRPRMALNKHDHHFGWFDAVARRWGHDSIEVEQATALASDQGKQYLPGFAITEQPDLKVAKAG